MASYHVNGKGEPGLCRAQKTCPFGASEDHFATKEEARAMFEVSMGSGHMAIASTKLGAAATVDRALTIPLREAEKPAWWANYEATLKDAGLAAPELLATIPSKQGPLAVVWLPQSDKQTDYWSRLDSGINTQVCALLSLSTTEEVGYLRISHATDATFEQSFGNDEYSAFRYMHNCQGAQLGLEDADGHDESLSLTPETELAFKRKLWARANNALKWTPTSSENLEKLAYWQSLSEAHAPSDPAVLEADLQKIREAFQEKMDKDKAFWSHPLPAYSSLEEKATGQGLGSAIYLFAARRLAEEDCALYSAESQTKSSKALWDRFAKDERMPVMASDYDGHDHFVLDFRQGQAR